MKVGSFFPLQAKSTLYAMGADDCSLFFDLNALTEKQRADHRANIALTSALQVALIALGKPTDWLAMFEEFRDPRWAPFVERYRRLFHAAGYPSIPADHTLFGRSENLYASIADRLPDVDLINLYMVSGTNATLHRDPEALETSRNLNSKFHFARHAPAFGIAVPETHLATKGTLHSPETTAFVTRCLAADGAVMLKIPGLAGARNVTSVASLGEAAAYVDEYDDEMGMLFQQKLDLSRYTEMTADLLVSDKEISVANVRRILFADGLWIGNHIPAKPDLTPAQEAAVLRVGEYARSHGLGVPEGNNCGIDYFVGPEGEIIVTEINVRWTGGLFPTQAISRIKPEGADAVVCFDLVSPESLGAYLDFVEAHPPGLGEGAFSQVSLGFSPFVQEIGGVEMLYVWHLVMGDWAAFLAAKRAALPADALPTTELIRLSA